MEERLSTTKKKKRILELLLAGKSPGLAALAVNTTRQQAYVWKDKDPAFAEKWDDAVATGLDRLESSVMKRALAGSDGLATFLLKCRRSEVYNPDRQIANNTLNVRVGTFYEAMNKIESLGQPLPMIEYDDVEDDDK